MKLMIADIDTDRMKVNVATFPGIGMMADWRGKASSIDRENHQICGKVHGGERKPARSEDHDQYARPGEQKILQAGIRSGDQRIGRQAHGGRGPQIGARGKRSEPVQQRRQQPDQGKRQQRCNERKIALAVYQQVDDGKAGIGKDRRKADEVEERGAALLALVGIADAVIEITRERLQCRPGVIFNCRECHGQVPGPIDGFYPKFHPRARDGVGGVLSPEYALRRFRRSPPLRAGRRASCGNRTIWIRRPRLPRRASARFTPFNPPGFRLGHPRKGIRSSWRAS